MPPANAASLCIILGRRQRLVMLAAGLGLLYASACRTSDTESASDDVDGKTGGEGGVSSPNPNEKGGTGGSQNAGGNGGLGGATPSVGGQTSGGTAGASGGMAGTAAGGAGGQPAPAGQGGSSFPMGGAAGGLVIFTGPLPPLVSKTNVPALPVSTVAAQDDLINQLKSKVAQFEVDRDPAGNVTRIKMWNKNTAAGNVSDALISKVTTFHKLQSVHIEAQDVSDAGLAFLEKMAALREARFHYMDVKGGATKAFIRYLKVHPDLTALEIKHNFSLAGTLVNELPAMPNLTRLVLDNGSAGPEALEFLKAAKRVEDLQIHRTTMNDDQIAAFLSQMPNLRCLELKHNAKGALNLTSFRAFAGHKNIRQVRVTAQSAKRPYVYEGALEYLTKLPTLKVVQLEVGDPNAPEKDLPQAFLDALPESVNLVLVPYPSGGTFLDECPPS
ncbi:MAG: hypothetical protein SF187_05845 [Deltaproteobacteria bacterium]|nr:hypothetical protein [Deltaproteobacteria bacterium]